MEQLSTKRSQRLLDPGSTIAPLKVSISSSSLSVAASDSKTALKTSPVLRERLWRVVFPWIPSKRGGTEGGVCVPLDDG